MLLNVSTSFELSAVKRSNRKMKLKVILCIWLFASMLLIRSDAFISINIDPEDLDRVSEFFHSIIINQQPQMIIQTSTRRVIISLIKRSVPYN